jgi:hypothetical protein
MSYIFFILAKKKKLLETAAGIQTERMILENINKINTFPTNKYNESAAR